VAAALTLTTDPNRPTSACLTLNDTRAGAFALKVTFTVSKFFITAFRLFGVNDRPTQSVGRRAPEVG